MQFRERASSSWWPGVPLPSMPGGLDARQLALEWHVLRLLGVWWVARCVIYYLGPEWRMPWFYIHPYIYVIYRHINTIFFHWIVWRSYLIAMCTCVWPAAYRWAWGSDWWGLVDPWPSLCYTGIDRIKEIFQLQKLKEYILVMCVHMSEQDSEICELPVRLARSAGAPGRCALHFFPTCWHSEVARSFLSPQVTLNFGADGGKDAVSCRLPWSTCVLCHQGFYCGASQWKQGPRQESPYRGSQPHTSLKILPASPHLTKAPRCPIVWLVGGTVRDGGVYLGFVLPS